MSRYDELCAMIHGRCRRNASMKDYTTMKVGGPADLVIHPDNEDELAAAIMWLKQNSINYFYIKIRQ